MLIESLPYPHAIEVESRFIQSSLAGASVRVGFTLTHWYTQKKKTPFRQTPFRLTSTPFVF